MTRFSRVRPVRHVLAALAAAVATAGATRAAAQEAASPPPVPYESSVDVERDWSDQIPAHVYAVDGTVELERDATVQPADENEPLLAGDRLRTARGRVEVLFADGSSLALDDYTEVDLLSDALIRLNAGRVRLSIARGASALDYRVDAGGATASLQAAGDYRVELDGRSGEPDVRLIVLRGVGELSTQYGRTLVRSGYEARTTARTQPSLPYAVNVSLYDGFDRWVEDQYRYRTGGRSAQYLPAELRHYAGAFDHHGAWQHEAGYGYVWYPSVAADWRPYYHGGWSFVGSFGWTWVGAGRWNWPTHHYGRWGFRANRWFWIPGRRWAPAWVVWGSAPGYVSWCPLGFDNRPVFAITSITVYRGVPRHGWTVLPTHAFRSRVAVSRYAVRTVPSGVGSRFAVHRSAPIRPAVVTTKVAEPLRAPTLASTRRAVARSRSAVTAAPSVSTGSAAGSGAGTANIRTARSRAATASGGGRIAATPERGRPDDQAAAPSERSQPARVRTRPRADAPAPAAPPAERAPERRAAPRNPRAAPSPPPQRATPPASDRGSDAPASRRATGRQSRAISPSGAPVQSQVGRAERTAARPTWTPPSAPRASRAAEGRARVQPNASSAPARAVRPATRAERPAPAPRVERSRPASAPRVERSQPAAAPPRAQRSAPSRSAPSSGGGNPRGQARSRNR